MEREDKPLGVKQPLTGPEDYSDWKDNVTCALDMKGLLTSITDAGRQDADGNAVPQTAQNLRKNQLALSHLKLTMDPNVKILVADCTTASEAFTALDTVFGAQSKAVVLQLKRELDNLKMHGGETIMAYFNRGRDLRRRLVMAGKTTSEEDLCIQLLEGLPEEYESTRAVIMAQYTGGSTLDVFTTMQQLLSREAALSKHSEEAPAQAYFGKAVNQGGRKPYHQGNNGTSFSGGFKGKVNPSKGKTCYYCNKKNHVLAECRKRIADQAQRTGGSGKDPVLAAAFMASSGSPFYSGEGKEHWMLDTAASHHISNSLDGMFDLRPCDLIIKTANGNTKATVEGALQLSTTLSTGEVISFRLNTVYYLPNNEGNLISLLPVYRTGHIYKQSAI